MINKFLVLLTLVLTAAVSGNSLEKESRPPPQELESVLKVSQILDNLRGDANLVWSGYDIEKKPLVITFDNGHLYAFNLTHPSAFWHAVKLENKTVLYSSTDHWNAMQAHMHPEFPIDGQNAYVFDLDLMKGNPVLPFLVLVHERFHQHQFGHFKKTTQPDAYKDHLNSENIALMQLEERVLIEFTKAAPWDKKEIIKDFMAVNSTRRNLLDPSSLAWEYDQQRMEGLADYVSIKLFDEVGIFPEFYGYPHLTFLLEGYINDQNVAERAMKWRHYGVGAAIGFALDFLQVPDWKQQVENQGFSQVELLEKVLQLSKDECAQRLEKVKRTHHFAELQSLAKKSLKKYQKKIAKAVSQYQSLDGIAVTLEKPSGQPVAGGGNSLAMYQLADGTMLSLDDTSRSATEDHFWQLEFNRLPVLFQKKEGVREFKIETDADIVLDGEHYNLQDLIKEGVSKAFHTIAWECKMSRFFSEQHPGKLIATQGKVSILYESI